MTDRLYNRSLHWTAILTAVATFPLIFMGGVVTTRGAGMSVPDWPNSYGYNMFLFPPNQWVGGILYEHTHRLMGTLVGFLSIVLTLLAWGPSARPTARRWFCIGAVVFSFFTFLIGLILVVIHAVGVPNIEQATKRISETLVGVVALGLICFVAWRARRPDPRRWVRWLCTWVLLAVILQGVLGGLRVVLVELGLAVVHGCFAQAFFCLAAFAALVTSRGWEQLSEEYSTVPPAAARFARLAVVATMLVYLQLIVGALMRHDDAGLAIPDLPLHYGQVLPPTDDAGLNAANLWRARSGEPELRPVTLGQVWLHFGHRCGAVLVTLVLGVLIVQAARHKHSRISFRGSAMLLTVLLLTQLTLGVLTVLLRKPADIASLHVAVGALVLVTTFLIAVRALRLCGAFRSLEVEARGFELALGSKDAPQNSDQMAQLAKDPGLREYPQTPAWHA